MSSVLFVLLLAVGTLANQEPCDSGTFTTDGECCEQCQPGEGVIKPCGATQTVCAPCLDSETFSESFSHTETCQLCTHCVGLLRMQSPCTDTNDAVCVCDYGYYRNELSSQCERCTKCPEGHGMLYGCEHDRDTVCEVCIRDTYSDQESSREPCLPCTICDDGEELELQACTSSSDTVCQDLDLRLASVSPPPSSGSSTPASTDDDFLPGTPTESPITTTTNGDSPELIYQGLNENLIPIYCSILAAVVVGLVAFIIFKRWNSCKQNKQGANNCTANQNQTPSPEGEKLHSDSGISVDSQSLQEQQGQSQTVVSVDEEPCLLLPLRTRDEMEKLLYKGCKGEGLSEDSDWCNLAGILGYKKERIADFLLEEHPVRALLSDWACQDCASIDTLCTALRKINRDDIAQSLINSPYATKPTATSAV